MMPARKLYEIINSASPFRDDAEYSHLNAFSCEYSLAIDWSQKILTESQTGNKYGLSEKLQCSGERLDKLKLGEVDKAMIMEQGES